MKDSLIISFCAPPPPLGGVPRHSVTAQLSPACATRHTIYLSWWAWRCLATRLLPCLLWLPAVLYLLMVCCFVAPVDSAWLVVLLFTMLLLSQNCSSHFSTKVFCQESLWIVSAGYLFVAGSEDLGFGSACTPPPFHTLEPPIDPNLDYTFSLDNTEGLQDLFDFANF